jgi:hypothetical protein
MQQSNQGQVSTMLQNNISDQQFSNDNGSVTVHLAGGEPIQIPNSATIICRGNLPKVAVDELKNWLFGNNRRCIKFLHSHRAFSLSLSNRCREGSTNEQNKYSVYFFVYDTN